MYNSHDLLFDTETCFLSYNQCVNLEFTLSEILTSSLWSVTSISDELVRCIPLFNCDSIVSSNEDDIVLDDNKCLICHITDDDTLIECVSDDTGSIHYYTVFLHSFAPYTVLDKTDSLKVYCIVYDEYLNTLNNVEVSVIVDDAEIGTVMTDNNGVCSYTVTEACSVGFEYDSSVSDDINITEEE